MEERPKLEEAPMKRPSIQVAATTQATLLIRPRIPASSMMMEVMRTAVRTPYLVSRTPSSQLPKQAKMARPKRTAL